MLLVVYLLKNPLIYGTIYSIIFLTAWCSNALPLTAQEAQVEMVSVAEKTRELRRAEMTSLLTLQEEERRTDRTIRDQRTAIDTLQQQVTRLEKQVADGEAAKLVELDALKAELAVREKDFIAELAARDAEYAEQIARYRRLVDDIASTPEGLEALKLFNSGQEPEALAMLDAQRQFRNLQRAAQDIAEARQIAKLALEARARGKVSTADVIERYEEITTLDPGAFGDWIELSRLQEDAGNLNAALSSAQNGELTADNDRDRSVAYNEIGDVLRDQGDLAAALQSYTRGLEIAERLAAADPGNAGWQRDVSVSLNKIGDVLRDQGDLAAALQSYARGLEIAERLAAADPGNAVWQRDVWVSMWRLREYDATGISWQNIVERMEEMAKRGTLLPGDVKYLDHARQKTAEELR